MSIAANVEARIQSVSVTEDTITAQLADGRTISVPLAWSWRLSEATSDQRARFEIIGNGSGIHWPEIDEDISVEGMLHGVPARREQSIRPGVFISHRTADADSARRLAEEIQGAGYRVWLDEWDILIGDSVVERINAGLENAKYVVVCYSESGVLSNWMSREWMSALARQLEGHGIKLLPVRLSGGVPPAILADIRYADLVKDWTRGIQDLLRAIR